MKKLNRSTGITLTLAMLFFSFGVLSLPLIEGGLKRQFCLKMDTFVSTWIEVAGAFAFSQGPINVAELAFLQKNDRILDVEVGNTGQRHDLACSSEPELAVESQHTLIDKEIEAGLLQAYATRPASVKPKQARAAIARSKARCEIVLPMATIAMADILRQNALARDEILASFAEEKMEYLYRRAIALRVHRNMQDADLVFVRAPAGSTQWTIRTSLRPVILNSGKRRLCPQETETTETLTTGPETSF